MGGKCDVVKALASGAMATKAAVRGAFTIVEEVFDCLNIIYEYELWLYLWQTIFF